MRCFAALLPSLDAVASCLRHSPPSLSWLPSPIKQTQVPIFFVCLYLAGIYFGQKYMAKIEYEKITDTRMLLAFWNFLLCTFSFIGACRTVPHLLHNLKVQTFEQTICTPCDQEWGVGATGTWVQLFCLSKIPELVRANG